VCGKICGLRIEKDFVFIQTTDFRLNIFGFWVCYFHFYYLILIVDWNMPGKDESFM